MTLCLQRGCAWGRGGARGRCGRPCFLWHRRRFWGKFGCGRRRGLGRRVSIICWGKRRLGRWVNRRHGGLVWRKRRFKIGCDRWGWSFRWWVWFLCIATVTSVDIMPLRTAVVRILEFGVMPPRALEGGRGLSAGEGGVLRERCARWAGRDGCCL